MTKFIALKEMGLKNMKQKVKKHVYLCMLEVYPLSGQAFVSKCKGWQNLTKLWSHDLRELI